MKLLVIGSGGREHALAKKMLADDKVTTVFCAKGNPGMKQDGIEIVDIAEDDHESLIQFAKDQAIAWTFVGPEIPLLNGIVDDFEAAGFRNLYPRIGFGICGDFLCRIKLEISAADVFRRPCCFAHCLEFAL